MGIPVGLQLDCYHLEHFNHSYHFAGHFITIYGFDSEYAYVLDGEKLKVSLENLEKARFEKGQMFGKALSYTIKKNNNMTSVKEVIPIALNGIAKEFLYPPMKCFGYLGIQKLGREMLKWLKCTPNPKQDLIEQAGMMEDAGTGGAIFRNLFRDFLYECLEYYSGNQNLTKAADLYKNAASNWSKIAQLIIKTGESGEMKYLEQASKMCLETACIEKKAMEHLISIC